MNNCLTTTIVPYVTTKLQASYTHGDVLIMPLKFPITLSGRSLLHLLFSLLFPSTKITRICEHRQ